MEPADLAENAGPTWTGTRLARVPELVLKILNFARTEEIYARKWKRKSRNFGGKSVPSSVRAALAVVSVLGRVRDHRHPRSRNNRLAAKANGPAHVCQAAAAPSVCSHGPLVMPWSTQPLVVRTLDWSQWALEERSVEFLVTENALPEIWAGMQYSADPVDDFFLLLAIELAKGVILRGCVSTILSPELSRLGSHFDSTIAPKIPPARPPGDLLTFADYELGRFFFLSTKSFSELLKSSSGENIVA